MDADSRRLAVLRSLGLLDGDSWEQFDELTPLAAKLTGMPIAAVTLIEADRLRVVAGFGIDSGEVQREHSFCDVLIRERDMLIVSDTAGDSRFAEHPLVKGEPQVRFYAGAPIMARAGSDFVPVGAICVMDHQPRQIDATQCEALRRMARVAGALMDARAEAREALRLAEQTHRQTVELTRQERTFRQAERLAMIGSWRFDIVAQSLEWSVGVRRVHEVDLDFMPTLENALHFYPPHARKIVSDAIGTTLETGTPFDLETDLETAHGRRIRVRSLGEVERENGVIVAVNGVFQDVTDRYLMEEDLRRSAHIDALTGIANRAAFDHRLAQGFQHARQFGTPLSLILIDLDGFKVVNDTYGHMVGDDVLRAYGARLRSDWLSDAFVARLGGDEFALILEGPATGAIPARIIRLLGMLGRSIPNGDRLLHVPGTIGWASCTPEMETVRDLIHAADTALYTAKRNGRGTAQSAHQA